MGMVLITIPIQVFSYSHSHSHDWLDFRPIPMGFPRESHSHEHLYYRLIALAIQVILRDLQWRTGHTGIRAMPGGPVCWSTKWAASLGKNILNNCHE